MELFDCSLALLEKAVQDGVCPSAAVAIGQGDTLFRQAVYGNACIVGDVIPANLDTRYDMASLTKILSTTMVAFRLLEDGGFRLYDTLSRFFPSAGADKADITVFQLMTHTGGFNPFLPLYNLTDDPAKAPEVILASELVSQPGAEPHYSCMGYILLGKILEQVGGAPLDQLAQKYVFAPLGMAHTGYCPQGGNFAATEVQPDGTCLCGVVHDENARFLGGVSGNAGVFSDLADMITFTSMLACGGRHKGAAFLSPAILKKALVNYTPGQEESRGLGFHLPGPCSFHGDLFPTDSFGHTGFTGTSILVDPHSGLYVVLLTNRVHPTRENLLQTRFRSLFHNSVMAEFSRWNAPSASGCPIVK